MPGFGARPPALSDTGRWGYRTMFPDTRARRRSVLARRRVPAPITGSMRARRTLSVLGWTRGRFPLDRSEELVRRLFEQVFNEREVDLCEELFAEDYVEHAVAPFGNSEPGEVRGPEHMRNVVAWLVDQFPDVKMIVESIVSQDDTVVVRVMSEGTNLGMPAVQDAAARAIPRSSRIRGRRAFCRRSGWRPGAHHGHSVALSGAQRAARDLGAPSDRHRGFAPEIVRLVLHEFERAVGPKGSGGWVSRHDPVGP
jgi:hypothetical protein